MPEEMEALMAENRRLREETSALREQVDAFERSRWWRLHPRFLLRRSAPTETVTVRPATGTTAPAQPDAGAERFHAEVVEAGAFSQDWLTNNLAGLEGVVAPLAGRTSDILEIGAFEGLSTCFFLWRLPDTRVTCVDLFELTMEHASFATDEPLETVFDRNVALVDASRVRKLVGDSRRVLLDLLDEEASFDLIYVDGSHLALDVLVDAALSWRLLRHGGTIVFDDYEWSSAGEDRLLRPGPAVDAVLSVVAGKYEPLLAGAQLAVRKL